MKRNVRWSVPKTDGLGRVSYASKCGRYRIEKKQYASGRNGYFNTVAYKTFLIATGKELGENDKLVTAKDEADYHNDPNWEPDS